MMSPQDQQRQLERGWEHLEAIRNFKDLPEDVKSLVWENSRLGRGDGAESQGTAAKSSEHEL